MNPEQQRIAIAESMRGTRSSRHLPTTSTISMPMHEVICNMQPAGYYDRGYVSSLLEVLGWKSDEGVLEKRAVFDLLKATAAQHAEAFLRTIGKWKDQNPMKRSLVAIGAAVVGVAAWGGLKLFNAIIGAWERQLTNNPAPGVVFTGNRALEGFTFVGEESGQ